MGLKTTFGMCLWDPDASVKICFEKITLTNILVMLVRVGHVGQGWSGWSRLVMLVGLVGLVGVGLGLTNVRGRFTCGWTACLPACLPARGWYPTSEPALALAVCASVRSSSGAPYT